MSTNSNVRWLGTYKIYLVIATVLCVISPMMYLFRGGFPTDLTYVGTTVLRIGIFVSLMLTASRIANPEIRSLHLGINAAGAVFGLLFLMMRSSFIASLPFLPDIAQTVGRIVVVPWNVVATFGMGWLYGSYWLYTVTSVFGLVAASIWAYFLATYEHSSPAETDDDIGNYQDRDHDHNVDHNIRPTQQRKPWRPLLISFVFALAINLIPFAVIEFDNQEYGWLLFIITVPVGGLILVIGLIWSIVLVSNNH